MSDVEFRSEEFTSDDQDPAGSWDQYLKDKQGSVGLTFPGEFRSRAFAQWLGPMQMVKFSTAPLDYRRSARNIRADDDDRSYRLLIPLSGHFTFEQGDSREFFYPGKVGFFRWHRPLFMTQDDEVTALILTVGKDAVDTQCAESAPLALNENRPLVQALQGQARLLGEAQGWTAADWSVAYNSTLAILKGVLNPDPGTKLGTHADLAERARRLIELHAKDPDVTPEAIAAMMGIGERTLFTSLKLAGYPPPTTMLREVRVERAHQRVRTALPFNTDRVAFEEGFPSPRAFREAYRERFGMSPKQMREKLFGTPARSSDSPETQE
ncbi:DNA-binding transcriptional activator FeaR [Nocardia otitidiscaviarum]|uniref:DNA-binding transcriptional activator FeaR n=1 Tax=Nocardia otitidiscaviarum TaxID=1823 RepID=A0A379JMV5_9NOCA|nr:helix-turn-helix domain-containing protein [Nocardia otitidiscaviarum]SUD49561.1 DNA-binding transcriptional activator FeaR [Nocardia otitidiscaviarum]